MSWTNARLNAYLAISGGCTFLLGCAVYLFLYAEKFNFGVSKFDVEGGLLTTIIYSLPSFFHVLAFTLLILVTYSRITPQRIKKWAIVWGCINAMCEFLQKYEHKEFPIRRIPNSILDYFELGTFDWLDIIAIMLAVTVIILSIPVFERYL